MGEGTSIINLGELSRPATVLIKKVSDAVGGVFKPYQIKRIAKAEAEADIIHAQAQIEITDLHRRAMHRFVNEEAKKQENIEAITQKALPQLDADAQPQNLDDDWITNFFDKCRIVSDGDMQQLWAKVLAGEANAPGTYSKRTVNFIETLDKQDAILFSKLCGFAWVIGNVVPLVFDHNDSVYTAHGIDFSALTHLDNIGLVAFSPLGNLERMRLRKRVAVSYYGDPFVLEFKKEQDNKLNIGHVILTRTGEQLARICPSEPVAGFGDYVLTHWVGKGHAVYSPWPRDPHGSG